MSLFFRGKRPNSGEKPTKKREVATMICPKCQHEQIESKIAISTYCRGCSSHYKIDHGKAVANIKYPSNLFAPPSEANSNETIQEESEAEDIRSSLSSNQPAPVKHPTNPPAIPRTTPPSSELVKKTVTTTGFFQRKIPPRSVKCLECDREHEAPAEASSTLCPACGTYISLKDYIISENWNRRIQTRGNVTIQKKAVVSDITIRCHDLHVQGTLKGGVDCSGDLILSSHSKIIGKVSCKRLIIQKRAEVAFANDVECVDAIIDGNVTAHLICSGKLHLKKKALLNGNLKVATMVIDKGARHNGKISIAQ